MIVTCTRRLEFDAGHRVLGHSRKCRFLHGHRYAALITCRAPELDKLGMVIDFGDVKMIVGKWIDDNWDHNLLLNEDDPLIKLAQTLPNNACELFGDRQVFIMPNGNPTAENMAKVLFHKANQLLSDHELEVVKVRLYETPNSFADVTKENF